MRLNNMMHETMSTDEKTIMHEHFFANSPHLPEFMTIAKSEIFEIENFGSQKKENGRRFRDGLGAVLFCAGILTFATSYIVSDKSDRRSLQLLGGTEFGIGLIIGLTSMTKSYDTWNKWEIK